MAAVATYVFLDLETSGLPQEENNRTKITELSLVAVKRDHVLDTRPGASPRVQHKLTLCLNPGRYIHPTSTDATGLNNELLEYEPTFNIHVFDLINNFLSLLTKPVCLIAQNGLNFDFPILKNHLERLKVSFYEDLLCADCLHAFWDILEEKKRVDLFRAQETTVNGVSHEKETEKTTEPIKNADQPSLSLVDDDQVKKLSITPEPQSFNATVTDIVDGLLTDDEDFDFNAPNSLAMQSQNETTPKSKPKLIEIPQKSKEPKKNEKRISKARRKIFWSGGPKPKESYKLKDIYERLLNRPAIEAHRAENDCVLALETSVAIAKEFVEWIDKNNIPFSEVNSMKVGVPLGE